MDSTDYGNGLERPELHKGGRDVSRAGIVDRWTFRDARPWPFFAQVNRADTWKMARRRRGAAGETVPLPIQSPSPGAFRSEVEPGRGPKKRRRPGIGLSGRCANGRHSRGWLGRLPSSLGLTRVLTGRWKNRNRFALLRVSPKEYPGFPGRCSHRPRSTTRASLTEATAASQVDPNHFGSRSPGNQRWPSSRAHESLADSSCQPCCG